MIKVIGEQLKAGVGSLFRKVDADSEKYYNNTHLKKDMVTLGSILIVCFLGFAGFDYKYSVSNYQMAMFAVPRTVNILLIIYILGTVSKKSITQVEKLKNIFNITYLSLLICWSIAVFEFDDKKLFSDVFVTIHFVALGGFLLNKMHRWYVFVIFLVIFSMNFYASSLGLTGGVASADEPVVFLALVLYWRISSLRNLDVELKNKKLEEQTRYLSDVLEHDLSNQILGLRLGRKKQVLKQPEIIPEIEENLDKLLISVENLLISAKSKKELLDKSNDGLTPQLTSRDEIESLIREQFDPILAEKSQKLVVSVKSDSSSIYCDIDFVVYQLLSNLVINSSKYSSENSVVRIELEFKNYLTTVIVVDQGQGISEFDSDGLPKVKQFKNSGSGKGLRLIKSFIDKIGGTMTFGNNQEKGTIVTVCF